MKSMITAISVVAFVILFAVPSRVFAQTADSVWVSAIPVGNINGFISGDTTATGARVNPNRVYKLHRDSIYLFTGTIMANFHLTLIAGGGNGPLPVIEPAILSDNSSPGQFINLSKGGLTLKQLYILGIRPDELPRGSQAIYVSGDSMKIKIDSCIFDGWSFGSIFDRAKMNGFWITNNIFRNMQDYLSYFHGDGFFSYGLSPTDTVYIVNNTIFCSQGYAIALVYYNKFLVFNHNTIFLNGVNPFYIFNLTNGAITNNIFYGTLAEGQRHVEIDGGWFDDNGSISSTISLDTLHSVATDYGITEAQRNIKVDNNAYFWPQGIKDMWKTINDTASSADSVFAPVWMNSRTLNMFTNKTTWPNLEASNNLNVNPGFNAAMEDTAISHLMHYVYLTRSNGLGTYLWWYNPTGSVYPPTQPLPENLAYSNTALQHAGTDGFALGDLNWFPNQHNQWLITDVKKEKGSAPTEYSLDQNYPNPFNPSTVISYTIPKEGNITLKVFNILGQEVSTLVNQIQTAGSYKVSFNASSLSSGVYFYTLSNGGFIQIKKMMLLK
ncbi:MAG: T9SS type A sorting domain-containing protein [Ignavibacteriaceae bacterium]